MRCLVHGSGAADALMSSDEQIDCQTSSRGRSCASSGCLRGRRAGWSYRGQLSRASANRALLPDIDYRLRSLNSSPWTVRSLRSPRSKTPASPEAGKADADARQQERWRDRPPAQFHPQIRVTNAAAQADSSAVYSIRTTPRARSAPIRPIARGQPYADSRRGLVPQSQRPKPVVYKRFCKSAGGAGSWYAGDVDVT
jgi:hypothetical protein